MDCLGWRRVCPVAPDLSPPPFCQLSHHILLHHDDSQLTFLFRD